MKLVKNCEARLPKNRYYEDYPVLNHPDYRKRFSYKDAARPLMLFVETTNACTNSCIVCPQGIMQRKKDVMPMEIFEKTLQQYRQIGGGAISLTPMSGEVFLDPLLLERLRMMKKDPHITHICYTTNGMGIEKKTDEELEEILHISDNIKFSVYGLDEEEYETMTRRKTYREMVKNIQRVLQFSEADRCVKTLGLRPLKDRTKEEIEMWMEKNLHRLLPYEFAMAYANWGGKMNTSGRLPYEIQWVEYPKGNTRPQPQCIIPSLAMQVFVDGSVSFCACCDFDIDEEMYLGNVLTGTLKEMYNSRRAYELWHFKESGVPKICQECTFFISANETAFVRNYYNGNSN